MNGVHVDNPLLEETVVHYVCAREFGWLPCETDEVDSYKVQELMLLFEEQKKVEKRNAKND